MLVVCISNSPILLQLTLPSVTNVGTGAPSTVSWFTYLLTHVMFTMTLPVSHSAADLSDAFVQTKQMTLTRNEHNLKTQQVYCISLLYSHVKC